MLKWLRKYNTYILVVGGCLLMVAFLLGSVLEDLSRKGLFGGTAFRVGSKRVGIEEFGESAREYGALAMIIDSAGRMTGQHNIARLGGGENAEHWYLLTTEAQKAGLIGGPDDGKDYIDELTRGMAGDVARQQSEVETFRTMLRLSMDMSMEQARAEARLTPDQLNQAFAKLRGAVRLQNAYIATTRYSARRLAADSRASTDAITLDYVLIPAEREVAGIPEPTEADVKAHFDKYKDTPKGSGDFGIGYKLPPRVKLTWMELSKDIIASAVTVDGVEVEKRFLAIYPNGQVASTGKTAESERVRIEGDVRKELADKVIKSADQVVRAEIDKSTRKLDRQGDYLTLPEDWASRRPDFALIRETVAKRLLEQYKITIPAPKVVVRANSWIEQREVGTLEGIGQARVRRGQNSIPFEQIAFSIRELSDSPEPGSQSGVPFADTLESGTGNKYYFMVLDSRKESAPDSLDELRTDIVLNIKRLAAYDILKSKEASLRADAVAQGLEAIAKPPTGSTEPGLQVQEGTFSKSRSILGRDPASEALDQEAIRAKIVTSLAALDPLTDPAKADASAKTFSTPVDKILSLCIYRAKRMLPLTAERFRSNQRGLLQQASMAELKPSLEENPFSYAVMKKRLNVTDSEGRQIKSDKKDQAAK